MVEGHVEAFDPHILGLLDGPGVDLFLEVGHVLLEALGAVLTKEVLGLLSSRPELFFANQEIPRNKGQGLPWWW